MMIDIRPKRYNEMVKTGSSILSQGGLALLAASMSRWLIVGTDVLVGLWLIVAAFAIWLSFRIFELLQLEE